jgi:hypothetical protein
MTVSIAHDFRCVQTRDRQVARKKINWPPAMLSMSARLLNLIHAQASRAAETSAPTCFTSPLASQHFALEKMQHIIHKTLICTAKEQAALRFSTPRKQQCLCDYHFSSDSSDVDSSVFFFELSGGCQ